MAWWRRFLPSRFQSKQLRLDSGPPIASPGHVTKLMLRQDGALANELTGIGVVGKDPRLGATIQRPALAEIDKEAADILMRYEYGCRKYVEDLPKAALRKWIKLDIDAVAADREEAASKILDGFEDIELKAKLQEAKTFERQYGGAIMILGVDDGRPLDTPLVLSNVRAFRSVHVMSKYKVMTPMDDDLDSEESSPRFGLPRFYRITNDNRTSVIRTSINQRIHHTRVIVFLGWSPEERLRRYDFGISVLEDFFPTWRDYKSSLGSGVTLAMRANETKLKLKGLAKLRLAKAWQEIKEIISETHLIRSVLRIFLIDSEDEVEETQHDFSGVESITRLAREDVAAASGLSLQAFFGLTREGLSDRDEGASERDDAAVAAYQETLLNPINRCVEIMIAAKRVRVARDAWQVKFVPLREETPSDVAAREETEARTDHMRIEDRVIMPDEARETLRADPECRLQLKPGKVPEPEIDPNALPAPGGARKPTNGAGNVKPIA